MVFEVKKSDFKLAGYLFGTMHTASANAYAHYNLALDAMASVHAFAAEIDLSDPSFQRVHNLFELPDGKILKEYLTDKKYIKIEKVVRKSFGRKLEDFERMQPLFTINQLLVESIPATNKIPLDHQLYRDALRMSKQIFGLETMQDQIDIIQRLDLNTQFQQLKRLCKNPQKAKKKIESMDKLYAEGDIQSLYHFGRRSLGKYRKVLLTERNHKMVNTLCKSMSNQTVFAAIGAAHLYGNNGMIKLLKENGYSITKC